MSDVKGRFLSFLVRQRATVMVALLCFFTSAGTAAAVSYLALGKTNTTSATTTLKSGVNGPVLNVVNTNSGLGTSAAGLGITVPAGRAPISVNSGAGTAKNLSADKLDGLDSSAFMLGNGASVLANRIVLTSGQHGIVMLNVPGLGELSANCGGGDAVINYRNNTSGPVDFWNDRLNGVSGAVIDPDPNNYWNVVIFDTASHKQDATFLRLGKGDTGAARTIASIDLSAYEANGNSPCGFQVIATLWSTP